MIKVGVVIPTYKGSLFKKFFKEWNFDSDKYDITYYVVEDNPTKTFNVEGEDFNHYCWADIDKDLGKDSWIISRRSSSIRSYGYLKAWREGNDYVLTIDDDCYPLTPDTKIEELIDGHLLPLLYDSEYSTFFNVGKFLGSPNWMRGSPVRYRKPRSAFVSIGGWANNPDLDAWTQLEYQSPKLLPEQNIINVPKGLGVTMCGMNVMFSREVIPIAYFLLQGKSWGIDRVDDIWAGLFMKKVMDEYDMPMAVNGIASVFHDRASNALVSLKKEGLTLQETELLWDRVVPLSLEGSSLVESYVSLAEQLEPSWLGTDYYGVKLKEAMVLWTTLFQQ